MAQRRGIQLPRVSAMQPVLLMILCMMAINAAYALRQFPGAGGRALLQSSHGNLIVDYIGASGASDLQFTDLPISASLQYILPLSFAIDADASGNTQNGNFNAFWASSLTPQSAQSFKQSNPNVKLLVSLAGFSQFLSDGTTRNVDWYDPPSTDTWISNAVSSISNLVSQYSLDGVDVDYENFPTSATFTTCIGGLISQLKSSGTISIASIAPFGATISIYADLFANFGSSIDYVNYQFYADGLASQSDFISRYNTVAGSFDASKLLPSVEAAGRGLQGSDFIGAAQQLTIPGIMIFNVDNDKGSGFSTEQAVASFLST
ncbi:hypothetical protein O6H91_22G041300 [Diphasiastrum complanatum]|uniref:Uncharacterized protein n=4 Tax=Diphasiastrum complanatum TaxID=34168 RepID=A0ACC2AEP7_DIPCM|nr:hypothetical protein O6H91_22G040100 [Diphasiastrum complanatum]KAJ7516061.1 hypothetical protein O6H91_22G040900 [Diphasiastrum complanatum]KAJ7516063.1 hypothetical protein O6H91_22G041100 [Diphasiastrum complanatum]KAJ7516068.1 hypothetical protein O6H91_22G041300 [Diphasiastrum complanatum]